MFNNKKKIELSNEEQKIIFHALIDFRNELLNENKYADSVNEVLPKLKNKMKVDKYDLGIMINGLDKKRKIMQEENRDTDIVDYLLLKLIKVYETF